MTEKNISPVRCVCPVLLVCSLLLTGCSNAKQGAVSGAGIGALSGLAIGSLTGSAGKGAAIGAIVGGVGGAVIGDQNRRKAEAAAAQPDSPPPAPAPTAATVTPAAPAVVTTASPTVVVVSSQQPSYTTGQALGQLVGEWRVTGTIDTGTGSVLPVNGTARASIDKTYFLRIDMHFVDPRTNQPVDATSVISQTGGRGLEMTNSSSTSPEVRHFIGQMDQTGTVLNFDPTTHGADKRRRIVVRVAPTGGYTADCWDGDKRLESFTFSSTK